MPSGYTADIYEGKDVTVRDFLIKCSRSFGANIRMRDDSFDAEIVDYVPNTQHLEKSLQYAKDNLAKLKSLSREEIEALTIEKYNDALTSHSEIIAKKSALSARYESIIKQVKKWTPPTDEHVKLKEFAIEQLESSKDFDCSYISTPPCLMTVDEYITTYTEMYERDIVYYEEAIQKEIECCESSNKWNRELRDSLVRLGN